MSAKVEERPFKNFVNGLYFTNKIENCSGIFFFFILSDLVEK